MHEAFIKHVQNMHKTFIKHAYPDPDPYYLVNNKTNKEYTEGILNTRVFYTEGILNTRV